MFRVGVGMALVLLTPSSAAAAVSASAPVAIGVAGDTPVISIDAAGVPTVAWDGKRTKDFNAATSPDDAVYALRRPDTTATRTSTDFAHDLHSAIGSDGTRVLVWTRWLEDPVNFKSEARLAIARPGQPFGAAETVSASVPSVARVTGVALLSDGRIVIAYTAWGDDSWYPTQRTVERAPDGSYDNDRLLAARVHETGAALAVSGKQVSAVWTAPEPPADRSTIPPGASVADPAYTADRTSDGTWTDARPLSAHDVAIAPPLQLISNARGDQLAVWNAATQHAFGDFYGFPGAVQAALRPAGGAWGKPVTLDGVNGTGALSAAGRALLVFNTSDGQIASSQAAPGGALGLVQVSRVRPGSLSPMPAAIDDRGHATVFYNDDGGQLTVLAGDGSSCLTAQTQLGSGQHGTAALAAAPDGSVTAAWIDGAQTKLSTLTGSLTPSADNGCLGPPIDKTGPAAPPAAKPVVRIALGRASISRAALRKHGITLTVSSTSAAALTVSVTAVVHQRTVTLVSKRLTLAGARTLTLRPSKGKLARVPANARLSASVRGGAKTVTRTVRVKG